MPLARFLQVSDVHLGAPFGWLAPDLRERRRRELHRVLEEAIYQAIARRVDAILLPGDLFDHDGVDAETLAFAVHAFDKTDCPPVFIAPGNHDPWSETSLAWSPRVLRARGWAWPGHVHVFTSAGWSSRPLPGTPVRLWGRCYSRGIPSAERPLDPAKLAMTEPRDASEIHVALFHGSREGHLPPGQTTDGPFSDDDVHRSRFTYLAVGHYHRASQIDAPADAALAGGVRLAYAGSAAALDVTEVGAHGALEVRIAHGDGRPHIETEFLPLDPRRVHEVEVEVSGVSHADELDRRIRDRLDEAQVSDQDVVTVRLRGRLMKGVRYGSPGHELQGRAFHIRVDLRGVRPDHDLERYRVGEPRTTEDRYVRTLLERLDQEADPERRAVIEAALYYGLDAFRLGEVAPAYEELDA